MRRRVICLATLGMALAGCDYTSSGFGTVTGNQVNASLFGESNGSLSGDEGVVAFVTGQDPFTGQARALAGIRSDWTVGAPVNSGSVDYTVDYRYFVVDRIRDCGGFLCGTGVEEDGTLGLTADFDAMTVSGSNSELSVSAAIQGTAMDGTVVATYSDPGVSGQLGGYMEGYIGDDGAIGAFHGNDDNTIMSGGFLGPCNGC